MSSLTQQISPSLSAPYLFPQTNSGKGAILAEGRERGGMGSQQSTAGDNPRCPVPAPSNSSAGEAEAKVVTGISRKEQPPAQLPSSSSRPPLRPWSALDLYICLPDCPVSP